MPPPSPSQHGEFDAERRASILEHYRHFSLSRHTPPFDDTAVGLERRRINIAAAHSQHANKSTYAMSLSDFVIPLFPSIFAI